MIYDNNTRLELDFPTVRGVFYFIFPLFTIHQKEGHLIAILYIHFECLFSTTCGMDFYVFNAK